MTAAHPSSLPPIERLDRIPVRTFVAAVAPLFEGAPRFLDRLAAGRPFGSLDRLFERARQIAQGMPTAEQIELIDAHPRLGAAPASVSALSFVEQGYDRDAAAAAARDVLADRAAVAAELDRLNMAYEDRFGFRYCVFVNGRPPAELLPGMASALGASRQAELRRATDAVIDIAQDRAGRFAAGAEGGAP